MGLFNAVFQGGGVRGIGLVGALARVEKEGIEFGGVAGTSAGAIVAALYAAGYTLEELKKLLSIDFNTLLDPHWPKSYHLWRRYGVYKGRKLYKWIYELLAAKGVVNFEDVKGHDLKIIASDITNKEMLVLEKGGPVRLQVAEAVRMSASIPLFFEAYKWGNKLVVDGGLLSNYPLWAFAETRLPTLGFRLVSKEKTQITFAPNSFSSYLNSLLSTMLEAHDKESERRIGSERTIHIPTGDIATTDFSLTEAQKEFLYNAGYRAAEECINRQPDLFHPPVTGSSKREVLEEVFESLGPLKKVTREFADDGYKVTALDRRVYFNRPDAKVIVMEHVTNNSGKPKTSIARGMVGDTPVEFDSLDFSATFDMGDGEKKAAFEYSSEEDRRSHKVRLSFPGHVLPPGGKMKIRWQFRWPGSIARREDYWLFPVISSVTEDAKISISAFFREAPVDHGFFAVDESGLHPINIAGPQLEEIDGHILHAYQADLKPVEGIYALRWRMR